MIGINASVVNTRTTSNNLTASDDWAAKGMSAGACDNGNATNKLFFPMSSAALGSIAAFATYGVGFLARPFGAAIFGHFGDRVGRKAMLATTSIR